MILYAVVEVNEDSVPQNIILHKSRKEALDTAVAIANENEFSGSDRTIRREFDNGYVTDGGWTIAIVETNSID